MTVTVNRGFASGTPRAEGWKGVREGREQGVCLPKVTGVGRIGKPPPPVPREMIQSMRAQGFKQVQLKEQLVIPEEFLDDLSKKKVRYCYIHDFVVPRPSTNLHETKTKDLRQPAT